MVVFRHIRFFRVRKLAVMSGALVVAIGLLSFLTAELTQAGFDGVKVGAPSELRNLVSAEDIEKQGDEQYQDFIADALKKKRLLSASDPRFERVVRIAGRLLPFADLFNERAVDWKWEVNVVESNAINAFCLPGGKIVVFSGIFDALKLSDDETAAMLGHEIAHAVQEHARERAAKRRLREIGARALRNIIGEDVGQLIRAGADLMALKFSRNDEVEADLVGMELAARAGFDPRASISLWQKMSSREKGTTPEFLSTHPTGENRILSIEQNLGEVMPLYRAAVE